MLVYSYCNKKNIIKVSDKRVGTVVADKDFGYPGSRIDLAENAGHLEIYPWNGSYKVELFLTPGFVEKMRSKVRRHLDLKENKTIGLVLKYCDGMQQIEYFRELEMMEGIYQTGSDFGESSMPIELCFVGYTFDSHDKRQEHYFPVCLVCLPKTHSTWQA